jgi:hypothetical protein
MNCTSGEVRYSKKAAVAAFSSSDLPDIAKRAAPPMKVCVGSSVMPSQ